MFYSPSFPVTCHHSSQWLLSLADQSQEDPRGENWSTTGNCWLQKTKLLKLNQVLLENIKIFSKITLFCSTLIIYVIYIYFFSNTTFCMWFNRDQECSHKRCFTKWITLVLLSSHFRWGGLFLFFIFPKRHFPSRTLSVFIPTWT